MKIYAVKLEHLILYIFEPMEMDLLRLLVIAQKVDALLLFKYKHYLFTYWYLKAPADRNILVESYSVAYTKIDQDCYAIGLTNDFKTVVFKDRADFQRGVANRTLTYVAFVVKAGGKAKIIAEVIEKHDGS